MFSKSRKILAGALAVSLATAGVALATSADDNVAAVDGKVTPKHLSKQRFNPVNLFLGIRNSKEWVTGAQQNPSSEKISISRNVKINLGAAPRCTAPLPNGTTTAQARAACPTRSYLGAGEAEVTAPGAAPACGSNPANPPCVVAEPVVSVFNGPGVNQLRLHTYHPNLGPASPIVNGRIVNSGVPGYRKALLVDPTPETGATLLTKFNAKLMKSRRIVKAKCRPKRFKFLRKVTYKDASSETVTLRQPCTQRRPRG